MNDPGDRLPRLVDCANYGKGTVCYTSLAFFRELASGDRSIPVVC